MTALIQLQALIAVSVKQFWRTGLQPSAPIALTLASRVVALLVKVLGLTYFGGSFLRLFDKLDSSPGIVSLELLVLFGLSLSMSLAQATFKNANHQMKQAGADFLASQPLVRPVRIIRAGSSSALLFVIAAIAFHKFVWDQAGDTLLILASLVAIASSLGQSLSVRVPRHVRIGLIFVPLLLIYPLAATSRTGDDHLVTKLAPWLSPIRPLALGLLQGNRNASLLACAIAAIAIYMSRRDWLNETFRDDAASRRTSDSRLLGEPRLLWLSMRGFPGIMPTGIAFLLTCGIYALLLFAAKSDKHWAILAPTTLILSLSAIHMTASAFIRRDAAARVLLASLPITPASTLHAHARAVATMLMVPHLVISLLVVMNPSLLVRVIIYTLALGLSVFAAAPMAFINSELASLRPLRAKLSVDRILLALPAAAAVSAPQPLLAIPPLIALALLTLEAHRSARLIVRWTEDEQRVRETPLWGALLAFGTFAAAGTRSTELIAAAWPVEPRVLFALSALVPAQLLLALTVKHVQWTPTRAWAVPLGLVLGTLSGKLAPYISAFSSPYSFDGLGRLGFIIISLALVVSAPVIEELYFRGWMLRVIPGRWAPFICALAFAVVHPPAAFPAIFLLGLITSVLSRWGILAAISAHMMHNAVVLFQWI